MDDQENIQQSAPEDEQAVIEDVKEHPVALALRVNAALMQQATLEMKPIISYALFELSQEASEVAMVELLTLLDQPSSDVRTFYPELVAKLTAVMRMTDEEYRQARAARVMKYDDVERYVAAEVLEISPHLMDAMLGFAVTPPHTMEILEPTVPTASTMTLNREQRKKKTGAYIRHARTKLGLTQAQLASPEFSISYISAIERGKIAPSLRALEILARRLGVTSSWILDGAAFTGMPDWAKEKLNSDLWLK